MESVSTYSVKIKNRNRIFKDTVGLYRCAVDFFIGVILDEWEEFSKVRTAKSATYLVEQFCVRTQKRPFVKYDFSADYYKFPSYLRRAAINEAFGKVHSYKTSLASWEISDPKQRGNAPGTPKAGHIYPALYRDNCFVRTGTYTASVKVWIRNTWDWIDIELRKSDVDYIQHHCGLRKECVPTLQKRGKEWFLDFPFRETLTLSETPITEQKALAVDLGINSACVCSLLDSKGTVLGRKFLSLPGEEDSLDHALNRIRKAQQHGNRKTPRLWAAANGINDRIAILTAQFIVETAAELGADVIVFEYLDTNGKKHGAKKQRLHQWKKRYVQEMVTAKAHRLGMHVSRVNARGTSRLAYDGSGPVVRGKDAGFNTNSVCRFTNGKVYNCDLSASYNIGARYFVRELLKSMPATAGLGIEAKVPQCTKRSTCTLSTLINLNAVLTA